MCNNSWLLVFSAVFHGVCSRRFASRTLPKCVLLLYEDTYVLFPLKPFQNIVLTYYQLTTYVNMCWGIGQLIAIGVIRSMVDRNDEWAYRIPYALQWMWPVPLIIGVAFAPESPWWLVRRGRIADAKKALLRLTSLNRETDFDADETIAMMTHTTALEEKITTGASYLDCFRGTDLRRTEIVCMVCRNLKVVLSNY